MSENQTGPAATDVEETPTGAKGGGAAAGLGLLLGSLVASLRQLPAMLAALKNVTEALTGHRKLMLKQLETFDQHLDKQRASFDRWATQNTSAVKAFGDAARGHRQAAEQLRVAVEALNRAVAELGEARAEVAELKAMVDVLLQREGLAVPAPSTSQH